MCEHREMSFYFRSTLKEKQHLTVKWEQIEHFQVREMKHATDASHTSCDEAADGCVCAEPGRRVSGLCSGWEVSI